jgi:NADH:ubiquinone oxidoreductase subunit F (NADH-binding)
MSGLALLDGPDPRSGMEGAAAHLARLGPLPAPGPALIDILERSDLRGRGGAAFPVGAKWRTVAANGRGRAAVLVNGAEGEPLSHKDRTLMAARPHLVLDGAALAAAAVGAREVVLYVGADHGRAALALGRALAERPEAERRRTRVVSAPVRYVSGEETAAVRFVEEGVALPAAVPPRPFERGIGGRPTLVQNVESLAHAALIARFGDAWFRSAGRRGAPGTALLTVSGAVRSPAVVELPQGATIAEAVESAGGLSSRASAVLLGGYFGGWVGADEAWNLPLDAPSLRTLGRSLGCGVVAVLPEHRCGVVETARILAYLADQSARQCGPCVFGLRAISDAVQRVAARTAEPDDLERVRRWAGELRGRGACKHPDGAAGLTFSALQAFGEEFELHLRFRRCTVAERTEGAA